MDEVSIADAIEIIEKANANLQPELLQAGDAKELLADYAHLRKLADYGVAALTRKIDDAATVAKATGTSMGAAKAAVQTGRVMEASPHLSEAMRHGEVSLDQASEIAKAEESSPGAARELLGVAAEEPFHVLRDKARAIKLEAEQHRGLAERQDAARSARSYNDELGMINVHLRLQPHVGAPIVARAEAEAQRIARNARANGTDAEAFDAYLADAYAAMLAGAGKGRSKRPELVVLVSHDVVKRGWSDVKAGEVCKIPGVGPVAPQTAKHIAQDAFLSGVVCDGTDLREFKRWSRHIPVEVQVALELGEPPRFDGVQCVDCGNHFRTEFDHVRPHCARGPTSHPNLKPRCWICHQAKTKRDREAGAFSPRGP